MTDIEPRRLWSWLLLAVGYLLSPLSWWNDAFINIPIAYLFGSLLGLLHRQLFGPGVVVGYWLTNVAGLVLMQQSAARLAGSRDRRPRFWIQLLVAAAYTLLIVILLATRFLRPLHPPGSVAPHP